MKIKTILFDADGVIINSERFSKQYEKEFGLSGKEMLPFFMGIFQKCLVGEADLKEVIKPYLKEWKWEKTVDEFLKFWFKAEHSIDERVVKLIEKLEKAGIKCYLATKQEKYRTEYLRNEMGLENIFRYIFSSAEIGIKKPEEGFYKFIFDRLNEKDALEKEEMIFVDDSKENVEGAENFGINAYHYYDFDEFLNILEKNNIKI